MAVQAQHLVGFSLFGGASQDWMESGGGFNEFYQSSTSQQLQQYQEMIQFQQRNNQFLGQVVDPTDSNSYSYSYSYSDVPSMGFSQSLLASHVEKQRQEIDRFIALQNERLRATLQEQRKQQQLVLLKRLESKTQNLLRQKDEELAKASRKTMELEDCIRKVDMENQAWQRVAKENESVAIALSNTLEQVKENASCLAIGVGSAEDAESCCCEPSSYRVSKVAAMEERNKMTCKVCNSRNSCILFLPCRHLCSCRSCESLLDACPVCKSVKKACIDVFMS